MAERWNDGGLDVEQSGRLRPYLPIAALGAIIVVSTAIVVWQFTGGAADPPRDAQTEIAFGCIKCGGEFRRQVLLYDEGGAALPADCELCGKRQCAVALQKCPQCERYVLSEAMKAQARAAAARPPRGRANGRPRVRDSICPKCNCNMTAHWRKRALQRQ